MSNRGPQSDSNDECSSASAYRQPQPHACRFDNLARAVGPFAHRVRGADLRVLLRRRTSLRRSRCVCHGRAHVAGRHEPISRNQARKASQLSGPLLFCVLLVKVHEKRCTRFERVRVVWMTAILATATAASASDVATYGGRWDAVVVANGVDVPFVLEIVAEGSVLKGSFFNGERRITSSP